jgi:fructose-1,6-bisphosphatase
VHKEPKNKLQKVIYIIWGKKKKLIHTWKTSVIHPIYKQDILNFASYHRITFPKTAYEISTNTLHQKVKVTYYTYNKPWQNAVSTHTTVIHVHQLPKGV